MSRPQHESGLQVKMREDCVSQQSCLSRRSFLGSTLGILTVAAAPQFAGAPAFARRAGRYRELKMYSAQTGENIDTIYWIDGEYIEEAIREISIFMRDWRENKAIHMDIENLDILSSVQIQLNTHHPFQLLSGYRTRRSNDMIRRNGGRTARNSLHIRGMAADVRVAGRSVSVVAKAATNCGAGGVGKYSRSGFVHVDCGELRTWGR